MAEAAQADEPTESRGSGLEDCVAQLPECLDALGAHGDRAESTAFSLLQNWLVGLHARDSGMFAAPIEDDDQLRKTTLGHLFTLAAAAAAKPALAIGVGQVLHSFFWWGGGGLLEAGMRPEGPSVQVTSATLELHELAVRFAGCDLPETPVDVFLQKKCPWRWRFVLLLGVELGRQLAIGFHDVANASILFRRTESHFRWMQKLPFFSTHQQVSGPLSFNQNWDYFPNSQHWPVWPREVWPPFAHFMEEHYATFREGLEGLLHSDSDGQRFRAASLRQAGLSPHYLDWGRLKLIHSGGPSELCALPFLRATCELLAARPEIDSRHCGTYLVGASIARLLPGAELKPHFGTHPRLTVHLGLRAPRGASMTVAGKEVLWEEGRATVFDDTYIHMVRHRGREARYILVAWFCHPCDLAWRESLGSPWCGENPLPSWCGGGGGAAPVPGYGDNL